MSTATFDSVNFTTGGSGACPTSWTCQDIGSPSPAGSQSYLGNGVWTVAGSGSDIWGTSDQFHFVSQSQTGDSTLSAHVDAQTNTNAWAKAALMVRGSSAANAPYYAVEVTPGNNISVQYRDTSGGSAAILTSATGAAPAYVEVARVGTTYTAYTSTDGVTWNLISSSSRTMANLSGTVQMGLAVTSHSAGNLSTATFDQISPNPTVPGTVTTSAPAVPSGITSYPIQTAYNDASMPTSLTYSDNEVASYGYDSASGWLTSLSTTPSGGSATTLLGNIAYSGAGGAAGHATGADVAGGVYSYNATYDANVRLTGLSLTNVSSSTVLFRSLPGYDAAGNVTAVSTTLGSGSDNQAFCYDEQNRLVWAGSTGTPSCGSSLTPGSLTAANYTQAYAYDTLNRLTSGSLGSYTYGDSAHLHAATAVGSAYTAKYDAVGDMTCRAPTSASTCAGTPTGAQLTYDNEGRLSAWQNAPSSPTTVDAFLYDGAGNRVAQQVTVGGSITTTTTYVGGTEEITTTSSGSTLTKYFGAAGLPTAERVGTSGSLSYLATDGLGSVSESLDSSGSVTFQQLYDPYGNTRYTSGTSPTTLGYTGQRADASTGLDYYQARYYDPVAGQFTSADNVNDGLNRYGYVGGNPETFVDPTGHSVTCPQLNCGGGGNGGNGGNGQTVTITCTPTSLDPACATYVQDVAYDSGRRQNSLAALYQHAAQMILVGSLLAAGIDLAELIWENNSIVSKVVNGIELLGDVSAALTWASAAAGQNKPSPEITTAAGWIHAGLGALRGVAAIIRAGGWFFQAALDVGWIVATGLLKGLPGLLMSIAAWFAGSTILDAASLAAHGLTGIGYLNLADNQQQMNMNLGAWCKQNPSAGCVAIPSSKGSSPRVSVLCSSGRSIQIHIFKRCVGRLPPVLQSLSATAHTRSSRSSVCRWSTSHPAP